MMKLWNHYYTPTTIDEVQTLLAQYQGRARIVAGGTDLLVDARADEHHTPFEALVDITRIRDLARIHEDEGYLHIGAGVTHTQIVKSTSLVERATCLVESCGVVGGPQVRNVGTLGGNVAHALPAADGTTSLVALAAEVEVVHSGQRKWLPLQELFVGPGQSLLEQGRDLLLGFRFEPCREREASAFKRIMRPQGVALPILGCAVWVRLDTTRSTFEAVRVCIAPVAPTPHRVAEVETAIMGMTATSDTIESMAELAQKVLNPRTSKYRATAAYRFEVIGVLLRRTLTLAVERARTGKAVPEGVGV
ncbi:MAG: FAD binding domain-containing protein [Anaerolineae bacterium]